MVLKGYLLGVIMTINGSNKFINGYFGREIYRMLVSGNGFPGKNFQYKWVYKPSTMHLC